MDDEVPGSGVPTLEPVTGAAGVSTLGEFLLSVISSSRMRERCNPVSLFSVTVVEEHPDKNTSNNKSHNKLEHLMDITKNTSTVAEGCK